MPIYRLRDLRDDPFIMFWFVFVLQRICRYKCELAEGKVAFWESELNRLYVVSNERKLVDYNELYHQL